MIMIRSCTCSRLCVRVCYSTSTIAIRGALGRELAMEADGIDIKKVVSVSFAKSHPWLIKDLETVDGTEFVPLRSTDTGFLRFIDSGGAKPVDMSIIAHWKDLRTKATTGIQSESMFGDEANTHSKYAANKMKRRNIDEGVADIIEIKVPAVEHDGITMPEMAMKCKSSVDTQSVLAVELTAQNLAYIRLAMRAAPDVEDKHERGTVASAKNVFWRPDRRAYIAKKGEKFKTFSIKEYGDVDVARDRATEWLNEVGDDGLPNVN